MIEIEISEFLNYYNLLILICTIYSYIAISFLPFIVYNTYFKRTYNQDTTYYRKKEWYHFIKFLWAIPAINKYKKQFACTIKDESEISLEEPRKLTAFMESDTQVIQGVDAIGNSVYIRITLREKRLAESCIHIRLANGQIFQLPEHPLISLSSIPRRKWQAGGLQLCIDEPFSVIYIKYNGFLRHINSVEYGKVTHVKHFKFEFTWTASSTAVFLPQGVNTAVLAEAVAIEPWRNANWIKMLGSEMGYEQHGTLEGKLSSSESSSSWPLQLQGFRRRTWGPRQPPTFRIFGIFRSRAVSFNLTQRSYLHGCKSVFTGSVHFPECKKGTSMKQCDIVLPDCLQYGLVPAVFSFNFKAGGVKYHGRAFPVSIAPVVMQSEEYQGYKSQLLHLNFMINGEEAKGIAVFSHSYQGKGMKYPPYIIRPGTLPLVAERHLVAPLNSRECCSLEVAGRGTRLHLLTNIRTNTFHVVDGFCILTSAWDEFLESNLNIKDELLKLQDIACGVIEGNLQEICDRIAQLLENSRWPAHLQENVIRELHSLKPFTQEDSCWAVRGTQSCILDAFTDNQVLHAIVRVWGQHFRHSQVEYRRLRGLGILKEIAVVVQPTLDADISGTLFSADSETGNPENMFLQANYGLGINLNTNSVIPDKAIIFRDWKYYVCVYKTEIGSKSHRYEISKKGVIKIENNNNKEFCLTKQQMLQVAKAGLEIEKALGKPVKIEWAFYKDQLYILDACILDKNFTPLDCNPTYNYPFLFDTGHKLFEGEENLCRTNQRACTLSMSTTMHYLNTALQNISEGQQIQCAMLKKLPVVNRIGEIKILKWCWDSQAVCEEAIVLSQAMRLASPHNATAVEHCRVIKRNIPLLQRILHHHTIVSQVCQFYEKIFFEIMHDNITDVTPYESQRLANAYSKDICPELDLLVVTLRKKGLEMEFLNLDPWAVEPWLQTHAPDVLILLNHILDILGPIALHQYDFFSDPWENNADIIIYIIQKLIQRNNENKAQNVNLNSRNLRKPGNGISGKFADWLDAHLHHGFRRRSKTLEAVTITINKFRRSYLDLGSKLVREGKISDQKLIYHFTQREIELIVEKHRPDLVKKVMHRAMQYKKSTSVPLNSFECTVSPLENNSVNIESGTSLSLEQQKFVGTAIVTGQVTGRICVLENFKQIKYLEPGDILVTESLDMGWIPVLGIVSGWVCNTGNISSQAAVAVLRRNIPCALVSQASEILNTGDKISLSTDTSTGYASLTRFV